MQNNIINFVDVNKRGSLIVGDYRCGSHFLEKICCQEATNLGIIYRSNAEWYHNSFINRFKKLHDDVEYQILIINHSQQKEKLLELGTLDEWHVIRIEHNDIYRWFISLYFFLMTSFYDVELEVKELKEASLNHQSVWYIGDGTGGHYYNKNDERYIISWNPTMLNYVDQNLVGTKIVENSFHHGTDLEIYQEVLEKNTILPFPPKFFTKLIDHLYNRTLTETIPADQVLKYSHLPSLANETIRWNPNRYPDLDIEKDFENGHYIKILLDKWKDSSPYNLKDMK